MHVPGLMDGIVHPDDLAGWMAHVNAPVDDESGDSHEIELRIRHTDGGWRWIEHACHAVRDAHGRYLGRRGINRDISRRKQVEADLAHLSALHATLRAVYQSIARAEEETDFLENICQACVSLGGMVACVVSIGEAGDTQLYPFAHSGLDTWLIDAMPLYAEGGNDPLPPPLQAWDENKSACEVDCGDFVMADAWAKWARKARIGACCHFPIQRDGKRFGLISFLAESRRSLPEDMLSLFSGLVVDIGHALDMFSRRYLEERIQYELTQRSGHLRALVDSAPVGIGITVQRMFAEVNPQLCELTGYLEAELVGESTRIVYESDEEYERVGTVKYAKIRATGRGQIVTRFKRKDGRLVDILLNSQAIDPGDLDKGVVFTALDVTDAKGFERALRDTEARYRMLAENANDVISVHDIHGVCRFVTPSSIRVLGRSPEEIVGSNSFERVHPDDRGCLMEMYGGLLAGDDPGPVEYRLMDATGRAVWVESTASLVMGLADTEILVNTRDITARKQMEAELHARESRYVEVVENMSDGVAVYEPVAAGKDFIVREYNRAGERICGVERDKVVGLLVSEAFPGVRDTGLLDVFRRVSREGEPVHHPATLYRDGRLLVWLENYVFRLPGGEVVAVFKDITATKQAQERLRLAGSLFDGTSEAMLVTDQESRILLVNKAFCQITGYSEAEIIGYNPSILSSGHHGRAFYQTMWAAIQEQGGWRGEIWNRRKNGEIFPELLTIGTIKDEGGRVTHYTAVFADISQAKKSEASLDFLAHHDALTGLPNRSLLLARLEHSIQRAQRDNARLALFNLDLDHFKKVNDTLGHPVGDSMLRTIAADIQSVMRAGDTVARLGGDEFIILLEDIGAIEDCTVGVAKLMELFNRPIAVGDKDQFYVTASVGISVYPDDGRDADTLMRNAEVALYQAKSAGRALYKFYEATMTAGALERLRMETALREALERGEFEVYYQLQFDLFTGQPAGAEALLRWHHPERGIVPPIDFIPMAEEIGLIEKIGVWVLEEACKQILRWDAEGFTLPMVAVNLSSRQLEHADLVPRIASILMRTGLEPKRLELELTESMIMRPDGSAGDALKALQALGVRLAVDDFGTGYSSLGYLKRLPLNRLKIDRTFVNDIGVDPNGEAITQVVIAMGRSLGLEVIAEGIETEQQAEFLRIQGCRLGQGYHYAHPMDTTRIAAFIQARQTT